MNIIQQGALPAMGFEALTISTVSVPLTSTVYQTSVTAGSGQAGVGSDAAQTLSRISAKFATITVETNPIRVRFDGTAPTSTNGHLFQPGAVIELLSQGQIQNFRAIRASSATGDATLMITYWGA